MGSVNKTVIAWSPEQWAELMAVHLRANHDSNRILTTDELVRWLVHVAAGWDAKLAVPAPAHPEPKPPKPKSRTQLEAEARAARVAAKAEARANAAEAAAIDEALLAEGQRGDIARLMNPGPAAPELPE